MWKLDVLGTRYVQSMCTGHTVKKNLLNNNPKKRQKKD